MPHNFLHFPGPVLELLAAAEAALGKTPPAFPLTATVAVNPYLGHIGDGRATVAERLLRTTGSRSFAPRAELAMGLGAGRISREELAAAAAAAGLPLAEVLDAVQAGAETPDAPRSPLPSVADLAGRATGVDWSELVADRIGTWAAGHFDAGQAFWPTSGQSAYAAWRGFARRDLTPAIAGLTGFSPWVADLPDEPRVAFAEACRMLDLSPSGAGMYFQRLLATLSGWAQHAQGLGWATRREGGHTSLGFEVLTIRLIWDALILRAFRDDLAADWEKARAGFAAPVLPARDVQIDAVLQEAMERSAERGLMAALAARPKPARLPDRPLIQMAFCIDVRSEVLRRALEAADPEVETIGFAGFFGLPISHRAPASDLDEARAPVLLSPGLTSTTATPEAEDGARRIALRSRRAWGRFKAASVSAFAFVEAAGPVYLGKLVRDSLGLSHRPAPDAEPVLALGLQDRIATAAKVLAAMSLTARFARLVVFCGHGAHVTNAPHASALQCGACGGHSGEVNARALAGLLNDPAVRDGLAQMNMPIPADTVFAAGLHDTVSDDVSLLQSAARAADPGLFGRLRQALDAASQGARHERAARVPGAAGAPQTLRKRGDDWAETRPEWGLAGCAAFVAAPRCRSRGVNLAGRAFLHDYDWRGDDGFGVLELILTAPVVVASWISLQYFGSTVAPAAFGAGNKLLHNVVGGFGVLEGAGQTLRVGLPQQSLHDGDSAQHKAQRLAVVIEAPPAAITSVLNRHPQLRALFDNGWLALLVMDDEGQISLRHTAGGWQPVTGPTPLDKAA